MDNPIVGWENSYGKLKQETIKEGRKSFRNGLGALVGGRIDCTNPYSEGSTFWKWWEHGYWDEASKEMT